jgi:ribonucleotide monophosphatase NagD (HAD superfamily)
MGAYLARVSPHARVFVIGEPPLLEEIQQAGMILCDEPEKIEYVVAAFDRTFDYCKWNIAFQAIKFHDAHFIATNGDKSCPIEGGEIPDCAGIIAALEVTTGKECEIIVGKPSPMIVEISTARMGVPIEECLVIGDRLETDIAMGTKAGAQTALVLTGVTRRDQLASTPLQPDYVLENIGEIPRVVMKWDESS